MVYSMSYRVYGIWYIRHGYINIRILQNIVAGNPLICLRMKDPYVSAVFWAPRVVQVDNKFPYLENSTLGKLP